MEDQEKEMLKMTLSKWLPGLKSTKNATFITAEEVAVYLLENEPSFKKIEYRRIGHLMRRAGFKYAFKKHNNKTIRGYWAATNNRVDPSDINERIEAAEATPLRNKVVSSKSLVFETVDDIITHMAENFPAYSSKLPPDIIALHKDNPNLVFLSATKKNRIIYYAGFTQKWVQTK